MLFVDPEAIIAERLGPGRQLQETTRRLIQPSATAPVPDPLAAFAWDGTELPLDGPIPNFGDGLARLIARDQLLPIYRAQLRNGKTTRTSLSPSQDGTAR